MGLEALMATEKPKRKLTKTEEEISKIKSIDYMMKKGYNLNKKLKKDNAEYLIEEIRQYSLSHPTFYNQCDSIELNIKKKLKAGKYNRTLAIKGVTNNLVPSILKEIRTKQNIGRVSKEIKIAGACKIVEWLEYEAEYELEEEAGYGEK